MKYYGLIDIEHLSYGFVEKNDDRITNKFIEIADEYHQQLLEEQAQGLEIVSDNKTVFTAKRNLYFVNEQGLWEKKTTEEYEEEQKQQEAERIAKLTMTPLDFINFLVKSGLTLEQINAYLEANLSVKMQLTYCSDVFCEVACSLMPITIDDITITKDMVITAFKVKHEEVIEE